MKLWEYNCFVKKCKNILFSFQVAQNWSLFSVCLNAMPENENHSTVYQLVKFGFIKMLVNLEDGSKCLTFLAVPFIEKRIFVLSVMLVRFVMMASET